MTSLAPLLFPLAFLAPALGGYAQTAAMDPSSPNLLLMESIRQRESNDLINRKGAAHAAPHVPPSRQLDA